jgi:hypothetical protein
MQAGTLKAESHAVDNQVLRLAVISTPRSGNTWIRRILAQTFCLDQVAVHTPEDVDWDTLPSRCILQLHWHRTDSFRTLLNDNEFQVVAIARHPLDVLISILHFAPREPETASWLAGKEGSEHAIYHRTPVDAAFIDYATSPRAEALLGVSYQWWEDPTAHRIRYEDTVADPKAELNQLGESIGVPVCPRVLADAIDDNTLESQRRHSQNGHFWRGQPGHWKQFLPPKEARHIAAVHQRVFARLGYSCTPDPTLDPARAHSNWIEGGLEPGAGTASRRPLPEMIPNHWR